MAEPYRLADEPRPSGLSHLACNPVWPLFGHMFGGAWLAWPWYVLNAFAVGSPKRWRDLILVLAGFALTFAALLGLFIAADAGVIAEGLVPYGIILVVGLKLGLSYFLYDAQVMAFALHQHYGGKVRNGIVVVAVAGFFLRAQVVALLEGVPLLLMVLM